MTMERLHDRLPWYVSGTLGEEESRQFAGHLGGCEACRKELNVLESMKRELEEHGDDLLRDHPPPEKLAAALLDHAEEPLSAEETAVVRRHVAICATCAEESRWMRGEAVAEIAPPMRATVVDAGPRFLARSRSWLAAGALAAATLIAALLISRSGRAPGPEPAPPPLIARYQALPESARGSDPTLLVAGAGDTTVRVSLTPDFAAAAFPLTLEIAAPDGRTELRKDGIQENDLNGGLLYLEIPRGVVPDGDHILRLSSPSGTERAQDFPVRVETR